jgi:hypothetical protein
MVATMILANFFAGPAGPHYFDLYENFQSASESGKSTSIEINRACMDSGD